MSKPTFSKINSHNEWDKLKEVIVGDARGTRATLSWNNEKEIDKEKYNKAVDLAKKASPDWFVDEVCEDLDNLSKTLKDLGATVHRPEIFDINKV